MVHCEPSGLKIFIGPVSGRSALGEGRWGWGEGDG